MPKQVTIFDRKTGGKLVRNAVDAREILASDPERYSGKVAKRQEEAPEGPPVIDPPNTPAAPKVKKVSAKKAKAKPE